MNVIGRILFAIALVALTVGTAAADTFGGFGGREDGYLVGKDRICTPLAVDAGVATGSPSCKKSTDDEIAQLSVKSPKALHGQDASHSATAKSRTLTVSKGENVIVTWESADPISKVEAVYLSTYGNLVGVEYTVRRGGRDITDVVVFDVRDGTKPDPSTSTTTSTSTSTTDAVPVATPEMKKALKAARKAAKGSAKKALKAWQKVLAIDPASSEALYGQAVAQAKAKKMDDAMTTLETLAASTRIDAVEYRVKARFDKAFAKVRADARYRAATGLDQPYGTFYERLMGQGGTWSQDGEACQTPAVKLELNQDRTFKLAVSGNCSGDKYTYKFKGTWKPNDPVLTVVLPNKATGDETFDCALGRDGDEDTISCTLGDDLSFVVRPVRR